MMNLLPTCGEIKWINKKNANNVDDSCYSWERNLMKQKSIIAYVKMPSSYFLSFRLGVLMYAGEINMFIVIGAKFKM